MEQRYYRDLPCQADSDKRIRIPLNIVRVEQFSFPNGNMQHYLKFFCPECQLIDSTKIGRGVFNVLKDLCETRLIEIKPNKAETVPQSLIQEDEIDEFAAHLQEAPVSFIMKDLEAS
jgi:hypothetical protein